MNTTFEAISRKPGGPSTVTEVSGEAKPLTQKEPNLIAKTSDQLGAATRRSSTEPDKPAQQSTDPFKVVTNILREGDFFVTPDEVQAIRALKVDIANWDAKITEHCPDTISQRHKATRFYEPTLTLEESQRQGRDLKFGCKIKKRERMAEFAPTALVIVQRAVEICEGTEGLVEESERDRASAYGITFEPSRALLEIQKAQWFLKEFRRVTTQSPNLIDVSIVLRLVAPFSTD